MKVRGVNVDEFFGEDDKRDYCYLSAIVYPVILIGLSLIIYCNGNLALLNLIFAIIFAIATGVFILLGGFYLIIIPLPIIYLFKSGCTRFFLPTWKKILYGFLSFLFAILVFVSIFPIN